MRGCVEGVSHRTHGALPSHAPDLVARVHFSQSVHLDNNNISDLSPLSQLHYLTVVTASHNRLSTPLGVSGSDCADHHIAPRGFMTLPWTLVSPAAFAPGAFKENGHPADYSVVRTSILREADVSHNHIKVMGDLAHHRRLLKLNLSHNHIRGITGLVTLDALQVGLGGVWGVGCALL